MAACTYIFAINQVRQPDEVIKTIKYFCENIKLVIPKITYLSKEELNKQKIEELTDTYSKWYLHILEEIRRGE